MSLESAIFLIKGNYGRFTTAFTSKAFQTHGLCGLFSIRSFLLKHRKNQGPFLAEGSFPLFLSFHSWDWMIHRLAFLFLNKQLLLPPLPPPPFFTSQPREHSGEKLFPSCWSFNWRTPSFTVESTVWPTFRWKPGFFFLLKLPQPFTLLSHMNLQSDWL